MHVAARIQATALVALAVLVAACGSGAVPTGSPSASASASAPAPSATVDTGLFMPLPENLAGIPLGGGPSAEIAPESQGGLVPDATVPHSFELNHCGLLGPLDFDGSLWVPQGGHNGVGGPLTQDQVGELINPTTVRLFLLDEQTLLLVTPMNGFVVLSRHEGPRQYALCD